MIPRIETNPITFGYTTTISKLFKEGKLPEVVKGFYGGELTKDTVTIEHLKPHSKGGKTELKNIVLSEDVKNWSRGNKPLSSVFDKEAFNTYCEEFKGIKLPYFNGDEYVKQITNVVNKLLKEGN